MTLTVTTTVTFALAVNVFLLYTLPLTGLFIPTMSICHAYILTISHSIILTIGHAFVLTIGHAFVLTIGQHSLIQSVFNSFLNSGS